MAGEGESKVNKHQGEDNPGKAGGQLGATYRTPTKQSFLPFSLARKPRMLGEYLASHVFAHAGEFTI